MASIAMTHVMHVLINCAEKTVLLKVYDQFAAAIKSVKSAVLLRDINHMRVISHNVYEFEIMFLAKSEIDGIMCRCHLNRTGSKFPIHQIISNDGNPAIYKRQYDVLANERFVALILRVDCNCRITEHSFGAGGCNLNERVGGFAG